ncbi:hypothetical protein AAFN60_12330 [Roseibacillus persicicus]|uniref:hypothetical protein n=1 Tax=Roseibacillus persicicus TaxID=454148 RepID=UPI00398B685C
MNCTRCGTELKYTGDREFHEGPRWGALGEIGELMVNKLIFSLFLCESCGEVSFFDPAYLEPDSSAEAEVVVESEVEARQPEKSIEELVREDVHFRKWLNEHPEMEGRDRVDQIALYRDFEAGR